MERQILFIGIGQTGCTVSENFSRIMSGDGIPARAVVFDTSVNTLSDVILSKKVDLSDSENLGKVTEVLGEEKLSPWFPCDWKNDRTEFLRSLGMSDGTGLWRAKALLSFASYLSDEGRRASAESLFADPEELQGDVELYVAASLAGGTGAGLLLPITFYIKEMIRQKGGRVVSTCGVLAMPDAYRDLLATEQKAKAYANGYAALRELHAVNLATAEDDGTPRPTISWKLFDGDAVAPLFDAEDEAYRNAEHRPFDKVFLFEHIPGTVTADAFISAMAETAASFAAHPSAAFTEPATTNTTAVYGSASLTRVCYPQDDIRRYIVERQLFEAVYGGFCYLPEATNAHLERLRGSAMAYGTRLPDDMDSYCESLLLMAETSMDNGTAERLLGRKETVEDYAELELGTGDTGLEIYHAARNLISGDSEDALDRIFTPTIDENGKDKTTRDDLYKAVDACRKFLTDYYRRGVRAVLDDNGAFAESLLSEDGPVAKMVTENGKALHPTFALVRLCRFCRDMKWDRCRYSLPTHKPETAQIPLEFLTVLSGDEPKSPYMNYGEYRFAHCLFPEYAENEWSLFHRKSCKPRSLGELRADALRVFERIERMFVDNLLKSVHGRLVELIEGYRNLHNREHYLEEYARVKVDECLNAGSVDRSTTVFVGASPLQKETYFGEYMEEFVGDPDRLVEIDALMGEQVFRLALAGRADKAAHDELTSTLRNAMEQSLEASRYFRKNIEKTVFEAISEQFTTERGSAARFFAGRLMPLAVDKPVFREDRLTQRRNVTFILSSAVKEEAFCHGREDAEAYVLETAAEGLPQDGKYEVLFSDLVKPYEMIVRRELYGLPLHMVEFANDFGDFGEGVVAYNRARANAKRHSSPLWIPDLLYPRAGCATLPFIDPRRQEQLERTQIKAMLMAWMNGNIVASDLEDKGRMFFYTHGGITELLFDMEIPENDLGTAIRNAAVPAFAGRFEAAFDEGANGEKRGWILNSYSLTSFLDGVMGTALHFIHRLTKEDEQKNERLILTVEKVMGDLMAIPLYNENGVYDEYSDGIGKMISTALWQKLTEEFGAEAAAEKERLWASGYLPSPVCDG